MYVCNGADEGVVGAEGVVVEIAESDSVALLKGGLLADTVGALRAVPVAEREMVELFDGKALRRDAMLRPR